MSGQRPILCVCEGNRPTWSVPVTNRSDDEDDEL